MDLKKDFTFSCKTLFYLKKKMKEHVIFNNCKFGVMDTLVVVLLNFLKRSQNFNKPLEINSK